MASVNFSEKEYRAVAGAAMVALSSGERQYAVLLNELASKMNKALSVANYAGLPNMGHQRKTWRAPGPIDKELGVDASIDSSAKDK